MEEKKLFTCAFEVKAVDDQEGTFEGYASTFNNIDLGGDKVMPGAFRKTIKESKGKFKILADHNMYEQIGFNLEAEEDDNGLKVKGKLLIHDIAKAREKYAIAKEAQRLKTDSGLSIGYQAVKWEIDKDKDTEMPFRKLKEIRLFEYSFVAFPMNTAANVTLVKQFQELKLGMKPSEQEMVDKFLAMMIKEGFNEIHIKTALATAAAKIGNPVPDLNISQLFQDGIKTLRN